MWVEGEFTAATEKFVKVFISEFVHAIVHVFGLQACHNPRFGGVFSWLLFYLTREKSSFIIVQVFSGKGYSWLCQVHISQFWECDYSLEVVYDNDSAVHEPNH